MGNTDNHIRLLFCLNLFYCFLHRLYRVLKQQFTGWCTGKGVCSENTDDRYVNISLFQHYIVFYTIVFKTLCNQFLPVTQSLFFHGIPIHIAEYQLRQLVAACRCTLQHIGKSFGTIIKFMVSQSCNVTAYFPQHANLRCFTLIDRLHQCSHGKISAI